jgi:sn-glycerol 3-phosphate transport system substrate-binding protein
MIPGGGSGGPIGRREALQRMAGSLASAMALGAAMPGCTRRAPAGRTEASLWYTYGGTNREVLLSLIAQFHAEQSKYHIHATFQGDYFEGLAKLRTAFAARAAPALTHVVVEVIPYLAEAGVLERIDGFEQKVRDLLPSLAQEGSYLGGGDRPLVALPFNRSTPIAYFNRTILDDLKMEPPRSWEALRDFARAATVRGAGGEVQRWGFSCPVDWWFWVALVGQAGGTVVAADGTPLLGDDAGVRAIELWQTLVHRDRTMRPPPGRDYNAWQVTNTDFLAGRAAMIWTSTAFLRYLEKNAKFPVVAAALPRDRKLSVPTGGTMFVLPRGASDGAREAALAFLSWMMQPAQANAWASRTGYIPVSRAGIEELTRSGYYRDHQNDRVALDQLAHAEPWPWAPALFRIQREAVQPRLEEAVLASGDAREMLSAARKVANEP